ncbi:MAG: LacI family DNA-binding transcriptional regulator, partial [Anaerolineae bacterium]
MAKNKPTMRDVAREAKVSPSAVWMVIHNKPGIAPETSRRIWDTVLRLGYGIRPTPLDHVAHTVGLLIEKGSIPAIMDSFYGDVISGFQSEAQRTGYHVNLVMFDRAHERLDLLKNGFTRSIAGLAVANDGDITPEMVIELEATNLPVILIESHLDSERLPCVLGDNFTAGYIVTQHLLSLGHRAIAVLPGPKKYSSLVDRLRGCMAAMAEAGLLIPPEWLPSPLSGHPLKGYQQMKEIIALRHHPTAVVAISDKTAMGAMEAIREAGLQIPDDIAIASIDNIAESAYSRPPLTTVHIPKLELGVLAFQRLHHLIASP